MTNKIDASKVLLTTCSNSKPEDHILIVTDPTTYDVARILWDAAVDFPHKSLIMMDEKTMHGQDPNRMVAAAMADADVIFGATKFSLFHSNARREAVKKGARFVNMVDYKVSMFSKGGLFVDFEEQGKVCSYLGEIMHGEQITITTERGTNFTASINGRDSVPQYGRSLRPGDSSSPPDIECATCAVEGTANGVVYIDGSIPHPKLGLITDEIKLTIKESRVVSISGGKQSEILSSVMHGFNDDNVFWVGEIGIGLNPECELNGNMLEDEGCAGTVHFGFGSNTGFHGKIESQYHLDMVFRQPTVVIDGRTILDHGEIVGFE